jgi:TolB-like protein
MVAVAGLLTLVLGTVWIARRSAARQRPIVAVAIFDNETGDARYDRTVAQLSDVTVDRLTSLGPDRVGVIGNMAALRQPRGKRDLAAIARETRAGYIILGQLQPRNGKLSLLLQLIRVDDGTHVWVTRIARDADQSLANIDEEAAALIEQAVREHVLKGRTAS